jgi:flagellar hook-basal body complex protein FliE
MTIEENFSRNQVVFNSKFNNINNGKITDEENNNVSFGDVFKECINDTNDKMIQSDSATTSFIKGEDVNIDEVMIKNQEAALSLQFLTQTRDKLLDGYNTLSKMQL